MASWESDFNNLSKKDKEESDFLESIRQNYLDMCDYEWESDVEMVQHAKIYFTKMDKLEIPPNTAGIGMHLGLADLDVLTDPNARDKHPRKKALKMIAIMLLERKMARLSKNPDGVKFLMKNEDKYYDRIEQREEASEKIIEDKDVKKVLKDILLELNGADKKEE